VRKEKASEAECLTARPGIEDSEGLSTGGRDISGAASEGEWELAQIAQKECVDRTLPVWAIVPDCRRSSSPSSHTWAA
jgi:hypothetical protein